MRKKPKTVKEMARMGGLARAKAYNKTQIRAWGKLGGRAPKMDEAALAKLRALLKSGKSQEDCAKVFRVSVRTVGRAVARLRARGEL
jgi:DNA invertase Pin-like site-specific DNA recombinase